MGLGSKWNRHSPDLISKFSTSSAVTYIARALTILLADCLWWNTNSSYFRLYSLTELCYFFFRDSDFKFGIPRFKQAIPRMSLYRSASPGRTFFSDDHSAPALCKCTACLGIRHHASPETPRTMTVGPLVSSRCITH